MNQSLFLHIAERLEGFLSKLPESIRRPVLHELTPLKELFLQQRAPRFVLTGSSKSPVQEIVATLFASTDPGDFRDVLTEVYRWQEIEIAGAGKISLLDARGTDATSRPIVEEELKRQEADIFIHLEESGTKSVTRAREGNALAELLQRQSGAKLIGITLTKSARGEGADGNGPRGQTGSFEESKLAAALKEKPELRTRLLQVFEIAIDGSAISSAESHALMALLAAELPNEARVEMIRISRDRQAQARMAQVLVKSTSAICTAIGAQPIPLADLPILTTLQLVMVSGIMHISGRERSLRAATEFLAALGANIGAGMLLREGTRAVLKFFPGWGNVVCGMVAGAGTYAVGKAATVYFIEGVSLQDARRTYLASRKKRPPRASLPLGEMSSTKP